MAQSLVFALTGIQEFRNFFRCKSQSRSPHDIFSKRSPNFFCTFNIHQTYLDPKYLFKKKFLGPIDVACHFHSAIWIQTFLPAPRIHQCHVTVNGKSRSPHNIFQNAFPTFFVLPTFTKLGSKIPFQRKSSSSIPSPPHVIDTFTPPSRL